MTGAKIMSTAEEFLLGLQYSDIFVSVRKGQRNHQVNIGILLAEIKATGKATLKSILEDSLLSKVVQLALVAANIHLSEIAVQFKRRRQLCKTGQNYEFCVKIRMSNPLTLSASTKDTVVNPLEIVRKESVKTSKFFDGLANDRGTRLTLHLKGCASDFDNASRVMNLKVLEGDFATMDVNYALDDSQTY
ncbi:hypothetical protein SADUNF_Sadunf02G0156000 [Salix dunnii]|uniref:Uncharacterized protein n=1 Tax=Salix dunnii TaxID=1413687 RepID=A0A835N875_9ROSI|nr:hypothetical protein SADUNF_Sadunf02G0156000 [Salix dunnii]